MAAADPASDPSVALLAPRLLKPPASLLELPLHTLKLPLAPTVLERAHSTPITTAAIAECGARGEGGNPVSLSLHLWLAQLLLTSVKLSPPLIWIHFSRRQLNFRNPLFRPPRPTFVSGAGEAFSP